MNKRVVGAEKEELAGAFLTSKSVRILYKNYHFHKVGEIDIIGVDGTNLVFFEVKYRSGKQYGIAQEAVGRNKQVQISKVAKGFLYSNPQFRNWQVRFDVIAINQEKIEWIKNAFPYQER